MQVEQDPDAAWVEALSGRDPEAAARSLDEAAGESRLFSHISREHEREGRRSYIEIDAPLELHALVRLTRPTHILEVGVSSGVSSAYLLNALEKNGAGTLHSIDLPSLPRGNRAGKTSPRDSWSLPPGRSSGWAVPFPLRKRWDLRLGDKREVIPLLARELSRMDLLVYDVPHRDATTRYEFRLLDPLLPPGGVAIVDHGPGGELCTALSGWARRVGTRPVGRSGLGLYGMRRPGPSVVAPPLDREKTRRAGGRTAP